MEKVYIPKIVGEWKLLFKPEVYGNYVNDHSIIKDNNGKWHLFGITSFTSSPSDEKYFVHGVSEKLITTHGMREVEKTIDYGTKAWAPGVIEKDNKYYMYYGPSPTKMDVSIDLSEWMGYEIEMIGTPELSCHRDHMIVKINDYTWLMYASGIYNGYSCISCHVSNDLKSWRFVQYALTSSHNAPLNPAWGAFESPYVVKYEDLYYLFVTYTNCSDDTYQDTLVFYSKNPYDFGNYTGDNHDEMVLTKLKSHAGEIICDEETNDYYITSCGWRNKGIPIDGAVSIAKLEWEYNNKQ